MAIGSWEAHGSTLPWDALTSSQRWSSPKAPHRWHPLPANVRPPCPAWLPRCPRFGCSLLGHNSLLLLLATACCVLLVGLSLFLGKTCAPLAWISPLRVSPMPSSEECCVSHSSPIDKAMVESKGWFSLAHWCSVRLICAVRALQVCAWPGTVQRLLSSPVSSVPRYQGGDVYAAC